VSDISPGWYKDPADASVQRYWDGEGWLGDPIPADAPAPPGPPPGAKPPAAFTKPVKPAPPVDDAPGVTPRGSIGAGSYEDPGEERRRKGRSKKSGRPGH